MQVIDFMAANQADNNMHEDTNLITTRSQERFKESPIQQHTMSKTMSPIDLN